jgi:hypothetical protein
MMEPGNSAGLDARVASETLHPWQAVTVGTGLLLHAPLAVTNQLASWYA